MKKQVNRENIYVILPKYLIEMRYSLLKNMGNADYATVKALKRIQSGDIIWPGEHVDHTILRHIKETCRICNSMEEVFQLCRRMDKKDLQIVRMTEERDSSSLRERFESAVFQANGFDVEIVPGISNINRITATGSFPLTVRGRNESFWVWDGSPFAMGKTFDTSLWERVAATNATIAIVNPPARHLFKGLCAIAAHRHAHTPVFFCNKNGQYTVVSLEQVMALGAFDWSACHLLVVNPSPRSIPRMELAHSTTAMVPEERGIAS